MCPAAHAHHLWVLKTDAGYAVARGIAPERLDPYDPRCVKEVWAFCSGGRMIPAGRIERINAPGQVEFRISETVSLMGVSCDWGYRVNTTKGKKLLTRQEAVKAGFVVINSFFSSQYAKVMFKETASIEKPIGMKFELVPLENPLKIREGGELPIRVLFDRKPLADVAILTKDDHEFRTDMRGVGHIKMSEKGLQLFMARHRVPIQDDPNKDYHLYTTFFVFEAR
jgi:uncharacterized GH25 family protein